MKCRKVRALLQERCDGSLGPATARAVAGHLGRCEACLAYERQLRSLIGEFDHLRNSTADIGAGEAGGSLRIQSSSRWGGVVPQAHIAPRRVALHFRRASAFAVAAMLLFAAGIAFWTGRPSERADVARSTNGAIASGGSRTDVAPHMHGEPAVEPDVVLTGETAERFLIVAEKSTHPRVHIFRLHAVYHASDTDTAAATRPGSVVAAAVVWRPGSDAFE